MNIALQILQTNVHVEFFTRRLVFSHCFQCELFSRLTAQKYIRDINQVSWFAKGIKNGCPCIVEIISTQGCALVGDPARAVGECRDVAKVSASDLHNARATILNPFYNMEYKIIKKIRQNTTWIEADILDMNLTPNR